MKAYRKKYMSKDMKTRVSLLERQMKRVRPELKHSNVTTAGYVAVTSAGRIRADRVSEMPIGSSVGVREGNSIRIKTIRVNFAMSTPYLDVFLILSKSGSPPLLSDFELNRGGTTLIPASMGNFTILRHFYSGNGNTWYTDGGGISKPEGKAGRFYYRFPGAGLKQNYQGSSSTATVGLTPYLVAFNAEPVDIDYSFCLTVDFYDV